MSVLFQRDYFLVWKGVMGMFVGISKNFGLVRYAFYKLENREQKIVSDFPISHFFLSLSERILKLYT